MCRQTMDYVVGKSHNRDGIAAFGSNRLHQLIMCKHNQLNDVQWCKKMQKKKLPNSLRPF